MGYIFIQDETYEYKIPEPIDLYKSLNKIEKLFVTVTEIKNSLNTFEKDHCVFFVENSDIFQQYMNYVVLNCVFPDNFYMYVESILQYIKVNHLENELDSYWKKVMS